MLVSDNLHTTAERSCLLTIESTLLLPRRDSFMTELGTTSHQCKQNRDPGHRHALLQILSLRSLLGVYDRCCVPALLYIATNLSLETVNVGKRWHEGMNVRLIYSEQSVTFQSCVSHF